MSDYRILKWSEVSSQVKKINPELFSQLSQMDGVADFELVEVSFDYGDIILKDGQFYWPEASGNRPYQDATVNRDIREVLNYHWARMPFGLVMERSIESYIEGRNGEIVPQRLLKTGNAFGALSVMHDEHTYGVNREAGVVAGCRSAFMLPRIQDKPGYERLSKYLGDEVSGPKHHADHFQLFKTIYDASAESRPWKVKLLLLGREFFQEKPDQLPFKNYLLTLLWRHEGMKSRYEKVYNLLWSDVLSRQPLSVKRSALVEIAKELLKVAAGHSVAYRPAIDEEALPLRVIQDAFVHIYKIRHNAPVLMHVDQIAKNQPLYYGLKYPTYMNAILVADDIDMERSVQCLGVVKHLIEEFSALAKAGDLLFDLHDTPLLKTIKQTELRYFHANAKGQKGIENSEMLLVRDRRFQQSLGNGLAMPKASSFFQGCIQISSDLGAL